MGFSNVSLLSHLGLLKLGLTLGLFLMLAEAIVEAGLVEDKGAPKDDGVLEAKLKGAGDEESLEDKLRQHLAAANTTRVTLYTINFHFTSKVKFCKQIWTGPLKTVSPL